MQRMRTRARRDKSALLQMKLSLNEKLGTLKRLDGEILELTEDVKVVEEIEQADSFKEDIYQALVRLEPLIGATQRIPYDCTRPGRASCTPPQDQHEELQW